MGAIASKAAEDGIIVPQRFDKRQYLTKEQLALEVMEITKKVKNQITTSQSNRK